jgi:hypothetical protein
MSERLAAVRMADLKDPITRRPRLVLGLGGYGQLLRVAGGKESHLTS